MKKEDFKVGQTVYLRLTGNAARGRTGDDLIREAKVVSVGRKYITVSSGYYGEVKFDLENFREKTNSCIDYELFLTKQDIFDDIEKNELARLIAKKADLYYKLKEYPIETLREIKRLLEI